MIFEKNIIFERFLNYLAHSINTNISIQKPTAARFYVTKTNKHVTKTEPTQKMISILTFNHRHQQEINQMN
ncbi:MAG: hypothetical protein CMB97_00285 [Flavobacteriaceae bacterium]|nr:hypothetical protein [Flavobacteriaceae bacterium]